MAIYSTVQKQQHSLISKACNLQPIISVIVYAIGTSSGHRSEREKPNWISDVNRIIQSHAGLQHQIFLSHHHKRNTGAHL